MCVLAVRSLKRNHSNALSRTHREYIHHMQSVAFWGVNGLRQHLAQSSAGWGLHSNSTCIKSTLSCLYSQIQACLVCCVQILVQSNHQSERIRVVECGAEEVTCPEMVDVIVSEPMGYMLLGDRVVERFIGARRWLKSTGRRTEHDIQ